MIADPAFLYKLLLEQAATIGCTAWWEFKNRKERYSFVSLVTAIPFACASVLCM